MTKLSERVRPDSEAAPWVVEEIKQLENTIEEVDRLAEAGLCYFSSESKHAFLRDIRAKVKEAGLQGGLTEPR